MMTTIFSIKLIRSAASIQFDKDHTSKENEMVISTTYIHMTLINFNGNAFMKIAAEALYVILYDEQSDTDIPLNGFHQLF